MSYTEEKWVRLYSDALMEIEHAKMRGRISDARVGIMARFEGLKSLPGLHAEELQAIDNALNALSFLEREENRYDEIQRLRALETATLNLRSLGPKIWKISDSATGRGSVLKSVSDG
jgi:hypothetical protein